LAAALTSALRAIEHAGEGTAHWFHAVRELIAPLSEQDRLDEIGFWAKKAYAAVPITPTAAEAQVACLAWCGGCLSQTGQPPLAAALLERAASTLGTLPKRDAWVTLRLHHARSIQLAQMGDLMRAVEELGLGLDACEQAGDMHATCAIRGELAITWLELGDYQRAERLLQQTLTDAKQRSFVSVETFTLPDLGNVLVALGRLDEAREVFEQSLRLAKDQGSTWGVALGNLYFSALDFVSGDFALSEMHARAAAENMVTFPAPRAAALAALARALLAQGRNTEALESAQEGISLLDALKTSKYWEALVRLMNAETRMATGDETGARAAIGAARDRLLERAERITDARMRESFLTRIPDNVRTLELAREWGVCSTHQQ
jgi:tetratricopeptide (TPR) repeat protein